MPGKMRELEEHINKQQPETNNYTPVFYRLDNPDEYKVIISLLNSRPYIRVYDHIVSQIRELIKISNPARRLTPAEYDEELAKYVGDTPLAAVGIWVYYPWADKIVHIVPTVISIRSQMRR